MKNPQKTIQKHKNNINTTKNHENPRKSLVRRAGLRPNNWTRNLPVVPTVKPPRSRTAESVTCPFVSGNDEILGKTYSKKRTLVQYVTSYKSQHFQPTERPPPPPQLRHQHPRLRCSTVSLSVHGISPSFFLTTAPISSEVSDLASFYSWPKQNADRTSPANFLFYFIFFFFFFCGVAMSVLLHKTFIWRSNHASLNW